MVSENQLSTGTLQIYRFRLLTSLAKSAPFVTSLSPYCVLSWPFHGQRYIIRAPPPPALQSGFSYLVNIRSVTFIAGRIVLRRRRNSGIYEVTGNDVVKKEVWGCEVNKHAGGRSRILE